MARRRDPLLRVDELRSSYGRIEVLRDVDLHVAESEIVTVSGRMARASRH